MSERIIRNNCSIIITRTHTSKRGKTYKRRHVWVWNGQAYGPRGMVPR